MAQTADTGGAVPAAVGVPAARHHRCHTRHATPGRAGTAGRRHRPGAADGVHRPRRGTGRDHRAQRRPRRRLRRSPGPAARTAPRTSPRAGPRPAHLRRGRGVRGRPAPLPGLAGQDRGPRLLRRRGGRRAGRVRERRAGRRDIRAGPGGRARPVRAAGGGPAVTGSSWPGLLIGAGTALLLAWAALVVALVPARPRGALLTEALRLLPDVLRLIRRPA